MRERRDSSFAKHQGDEVADAENRPSKQRRLDFADAAESSPDDVTVAVARSSSSESASTDSGDDGDYVAKPYRHLLNSEVGALAQWDAVWAIRELVANALDADADATFEFTSDGAGSNNKGVYRMTNRETRSGRKGLTPRSFKQAPHGEERDPSESGQFGYGLKDALIILANKGIAYDARSAFGHYSLFVDKKTQDIYVDMNPSLGGGPLTVTTLSGVTKAEVDAAEQETVRLLVRKNALTLVFENDHGCVYRHSADSGVPRRSVFLFGQGYETHVKNDFFFVYNIFMDRGTHRGRDKANLPYNWLSAVIKLAKSAPRAYFNELNNVWQVHGQTESANRRFWEVNRIEITKELRGFYDAEVQNQERLRNRRQREQENLRELEVMRAEVVESISQKKAVGDVVPSYLQEQSISLEQQLEKSRESLQEIDAAPSTNVPTYVVIKTADTHVPPGSIGIKPKHEHIFKQSRVVSMVEQQNRASAGSPDKKFDRLHMELMFLFTKLDTLGNFSVRFSSEKVGSADLVQINTTLRLLVLHPAPSTTEDELRRAAILKISSEFKALQFASQVDLLTEIIFKTMPHWPNLSDAEVIAATERARNIAGALFR